MHDLLEDRPDYFEDRDYLLTLGIATGSLLHSLPEAVTTIGLNTKRLKEHVVSDDAGLEMLHIIDKQVSYLNDLCAAIRILRNQDYSKATHDLNTSLDLAWQHTIQESDMPCVSITLDLSEDVSHVNCNTEMLITVFVSVFKNAIRAIRDGVQKGEICVRTRIDSAQDQAIVDIQDNGIGITDSIRQHLFTKPLRRTGTGNGLGLWLGNLFVLSLGGQIDVHWTSVGEGTVIRMTLPLFSSEQ